MPSAYRTRYAPSPTGKMHLGHARTALVAYLRARSVGGRILMRMEDIDGPRVREGSAESILRDHEWLGLDWDEGPVYQSTRDGAYAAALERLRADGRVYPCTCTRREVAEASAPHEGDEGPVYPGTCRNGPSHPERPAAMRFVMTEPSPGFVDRLAGPYPPGAVQGDFIVRRSDGLWAYQLAVVVDDAEQGMTEVVRGDDLLSSTPRQIALFEALRHPPPHYLHVPLVLGPDGKRLSKRDGATAIEDYREAGVTREALLGLLARSLGLTGDAAPVSLEALVAGFELGRLSADAVTLHADLPSADD